MNCHKRRSEERLQRWVEHFSETLNRDVPITPLEEDNLVRQWKIRAKYVDDLSVVEVIPRCSTSFLPFIARDICTYATKHGMRLNPVKCKEMFIDFGIS